MTTWHVRVFFFINTRVQIAPFALGASCTGPDGGSLVDSQTTFSTRVPRAGSFPAALVNILYDVLKNPDVNSSQALDSCEGVACNPTCIGDGADGASTR